VKIEGPLLLINESRTVISGTVFGAELSGRKRLPRSRP
jgi:hypothetical protein